MNIFEKYLEIMPDGAEMKWHYESDDIKNKIFSILFDEIDFKSHSSSKEHNESMRNKIARIISTEISMTLDMIECMKEDNEDIDYEKLEKYILSTITKRSIQCPICSTYLKAKIDGRKIYIEDEVEKCFESKVYNFEFKTKSDKLIFCNDIRKYIKTPCRFDDINSLGGTIKSVENYLNDGVFAMYFGNSGALIKADKDKSEIFVAEYGFYDNDNLKENYDLEEKGSICCDLWWVMGADILDVDMEKIKKDDYDHVIVDVKPNTTYIFEVDMRLDVIYEQNENYVPKYFNIYEKLVE